MSKEILKTNNAGLFGKQLNLPYAGKVKISEDGEIEVESKVAELLVNNHDGSFFREADIEVEDAKEVKVQKKKSTKKLEKVEEEETEEEEEETEDETEEEEEEEEEDEALDLGTLDLEALIELAKDAGFKEPTYRKFKKSKKLMIKFINDNA